MNTKDDIKQFLEEQFSMVEEAGAVSTVALIHFAHTGEVQLHPMQAGQGKWGNADAMAQTFDAIATRHARGVTGGGGQQFQLTVFRGAEGKPTSVLPFIRVGARNITGPEGSLATEPPTAMGQTQQAQRWGEQITQMAFHALGHLQGSQQRALDAAYAKIETGEKTNAELWLALKGVLIELMKEKHADKMKELMAARMTEFGRQVMGLAPALLNMMAGKELFPLASADTGILDTIASVASTEDLRALTGVLMTKEGGKELGVVLTDRFNSYHKRKAEEAAVERRLIAGLPARSYEEAERDAAGDAMKVLRGQSAGQAGPPSVEPKVLSSHVETNGNGTNGHSKATADEKLWDDLFTRVPAGMVQTLAGTLAADDPELARRIVERYEASQKRPA